MDNSKKKTVYLPSIRPTLVSGTHTISIRQTVKDKRGSVKQLEVFERSQTIIVQTLTHQIDPQGVHACYPPDGHQGRFEGTLPYVLLNQATLPWQLSADARPGPDSPPWLALLVFDELDPPPLTRLAVPENPVKAEAGEAEIKPSGQIISLSRSQFESLAPTLDDLPWLAHVRRVSISDKAAASDDSPDSEYAVVVGNRPCQTGHRYVVHLVALNGLGKILPGGETQDGEVELSSLLSWSFGCTDNDHDFASLLKNVDHGPMAQPVSVPQADDSPDVSLVKESYATGYCALDHQLRDGINTVSWYRGPLLPLRANPLEVAVSTNSADALLRYDPELGMFDTGYAAAWQLGRHLGLANKAFSNALHRCKIQWYQNSDLSAFQTQPTESPAQMPGMESGETASNVASPRYSIAANIYDVTFDAKQLSCWLRAPTNASTEQGISADQIIVQNWLSRWLLLYGVPLGYLIPEPAMVPQESLRCFRVDRNWLRALLDGALSLGGDDPAREKSLRTVLIENALQEVYKIRRSLIDESTGEDGSDTSTDVISGFILRSRVVSAWPGIEVKGFSSADSTESLPLLRAENLTPDLLLCLFDGQMRRVDLIEPAESQGFNFPKNPVLRGPVLAAAELAKCLGAQNAADFAARLATNNGIVTFRIKDQRA
ncbi:hypothetical protein AUC61_13265 [Pseudomonas sp. S25]|uniref:Uncharacterized protein n=1 Tax=Pseudomonas maioricensis TaxID=1766623 RepID=A0ABS9ZIU2_9PSED|nr:hypothetical protein [Pseudomonas sp. S25]MCI8210504.1 hypothetical protein [Pseudomonas sp. S25]